MSKKKQLTQDIVSGKLSRLNKKDLPLIGIDGLTDGDHILPFGQSLSDIIEYCIYDLSDNYLASGELEHPLPTDLDVGAHVRSLGFERGTYKVVYNFLRQVGGSSKFILTKKSDKSVYTDEYMIGTNGKVLASYNSEADVKAPLLDDDGKEIELLVHDDKYWLQEISPSRTEIRLRPNPAIVDTDYYEQFRLLGYTCLSYSDISGESYISFNAEGKVATINGGTITLDQAMVGGTLKIREAFVIEYEESDEQLSRYSPVVDVETLPAAQNLLGNGHFAGGNGIPQKGFDAGNHEVVEFTNPGNSRYVLKTTSSDNKNNYQLLLNGIPGESYIISCWVHWSNEWVTGNHQGAPQLFRGEVESGGTYQAFGEHNKDVIEVKNVDGNEWQRIYNVITIPVNSDGNFKLNLGNTIVETTEGIRYIPDVQVEAGSTAGKPTPYMVSGERVEEEDSPTTGLITFIDNNRVEAVFADEDDGFSELMVDGKLTIKGAYVTDQDFSQDNELVIIDNIPLKNPAVHQKYEL